MSSLVHLDRTLLPKSTPFGDIERNGQAAVPWEGIRELSTLWTGTGSLYDWLPLDEATIERVWSHRMVQARVALAVLQQMEMQLVHLLPKHAGEWLDHIAAHTHRVIELTEVPTAHTDWGATLSRYGRYPAPFYVDRCPSTSFDTPMTRTLKWTAHAASSAERLVWDRLRIKVLSPGAYERLSSPLTLPEIASAALDAAISDYDLDVCRSAGGIWVPLARIARQLRAIWMNGPASQLMALAPILPKFAHQLFELGSVGMAISAARSCTSGKWSSETPIAAAVANAPCITMTASDAKLNIRYQTVPADWRQSSSPYRSLGRALGGSALRPDIWVSCRRGDFQREIVVECKYSTDRGYVASGITQSLAYSVEFEKMGAQPIFVTVGPEGVVGDSVSCDGQFVLTTPHGLRLLVQAAFEGTLDTVLASWDVGVTD